MFDPFFSVRETLKIQSGYFGIRDNGAWIDEILHHLDLTSKADANMRSLSGGMKRRVLVGQALVHKPPVIVLDEPTAGVDVELRQSLWAFIRKLNRDGHTIILTTHYLEEAEALCGRIAMLKAGSLVALDTKQNLLSQVAGLTVRLVAARVPAAWQARVRRQDHRIFEIGLSRYAELEDLLAALRVEGIAIDELALQETDLEHVFLRIMGATERGAVIARRRLVHAPLQGAAALLEGLVADDRGARAHGAPLPAHLLARAGIACDRCSAAKSATPPSSFPGS